MRQDITCPKCGGNNTVVNMTLLVVAPSRFWLRFNKSDFSRKDVQLNGLSSRRNSTYLACLDCGWNTAITEEA